MASMRSLDRVMDVLTFILSVYSRSGSRVSGCRQPLTRDPLLEYTDSMKVKTSITLSKDLIEAIDRRSQLKGRTRSEFIEKALRAFVGQLVRYERNERD